MRAGFEKLQVSAGGWTTSAIRVSWQLLLTSVCTRKVQFYRGRNGMAGAGRAGWRLLQRAWPDNCYFRTCRLPQMSANAFLAACFVSSFPQ